MLRLIVFGFLICILIGCVTCGGKEMSIQDKYEQMLFTSVRIETDRGSGSGTAIDRYGGFTIILTARHVIEGVEEIMVRVFPDDKEYPATILKVSDDHDIALLMIQHRHDYIANWAEPFELLVFSEVFKIGCALGSDEPMVTSGVISGTEDFLFYVSSPVVWGDSGGGIFQEVDGEFVLIGVTNALAVGRVQGMAFPVFHIGLATDMFGAEELFQQED